MSHPAPSSQILSQDRYFFKILLMTSMTSVFQRVPETGYSSHASLDRPPHGLRDLYNAPTASSNASQLPFRPPS